MMDSRQDEFLRVIVIAVAVILIVVLVLPIVAMLGMMSMMGTAPFAGMPMMGMGGMALIWLIVLVAIVVLLAWALRRQPARGRSDAPLEILQRRYAAGEVNRDEYERMREELRRDQSA